MHPSKSRFHHYVVMFASAVIMIGPIRVHAQQSTGDVIGQITDQTNALVPKATVTLENLATHETQEITTTNGQYIFTLLKLGSYSVTVTSDGFRTEHVTSFPLTAGERHRVDMHLLVGQQNETVQVTAESSLKTDSSTIDQAIPSKTVQELPTNGRNFIQLTQDLVAGATSGDPNNIASGNKPDDRRQTSSISVNGQNVQSNDNLIDGLDNNERLIGVIGVRPSIEGIAELRVETNLYTADIGRTGGGVINIITKSGTDRFHGSIFEYIRNNALDARDYFALVSPELRQNQFGGSIGGPIRRNKTFFFLDYESLRITAGQTFTSLVPTLYEKQHPGDLTDIGGPLIPAGSLNPVALAYFNLYPTPNRIGTGGNFTYSPRQTQIGHVADARVDHRLNDRNLFYARYTINQTDTNVPGALPAVNSIEPGGNPNSYPGLSTERQQNIQLNYIHLFSPQVLMELKTGFTRINNSALPLNYGKNYSAQLGLVNVNVTPDTSALTPMNVGPYTPLGEGNYEPLRDIDNTFQYAGTVSWSKGSQTLRIGAALIRRQFTNVQSSQPVGQYSFTGTNAAALQSFLTGNSYQYIRSNQLLPSSYRSSEPSVFFQDDWRVNRRLTLNLGARYDFFSPITEANNRIANFDTDNIKLLVAGVNGVSRSAGVRPDYTNLAPRVGFAFQPSQGTVVRGGYGISYYPEGYGSHTNMQNAPFTFNYGPVYGVSLSDPAPLPVANDPNQPFGTIQGAIALNYRSAQMHQASLEVAQSIGANTFTTRYVAGIGRHIYQTFGNIDVPEPSATTTAANLQSRRPYFAQLPNVTAIQEQFTGGVSSYNAFQTEFQRRASKGLTINVNYTWARLLDNVSVSSLLPFKTSSYDYGNGFLDIRHKVAGAISYELPFARESSGITSLIAAGWQLNALGRWQTGIPFTVSNGSPQINVGVSSDRPNQIADPSLSHPTLTHFFNVAAFAPQTFGTAGDSRVNNVHGPHQRSVDVSLLKNFPMRETLIAQFRAEAFNVTNTPSFAVPNSNIASSAVGTITSTTLIPRQLQFAVKVIF